jgi:hypothetical protein
MAPSKAISNIIQLIVKYVMLIYTAIKKNAKHALRLLTFQVLDTSLI